jgi:hypothetical protein
MSAVPRDAAAIGALGTEQHLRELGAARAHQAVDAEDLAAPQAKADVFELAARPSVSTRSRSRRVLACLGNSCSTGRPTMSGSAHRGRSRELPFAHRAPSRNTA